MPTPASYLCVIGTRPEAVKAAPVVAALRRRGAHVDVMLTGQSHLAAKTAAEVGLSYRWFTWGEDHPEALLDRVSVFSARCGKILSQHRYHAAIVIGDTASAWAGAMAAQCYGLPVAHVEAGLRTYEYEPWPEEEIRQAIDRLATWRFCPTEIAVENLKREGRRGELVGATSLDMIRQLGVIRCRLMRRTVLLTFHRTENRKRIGDIASQIALLLGEHRDTRFVWPIHPSAKKALGQILAGNPLRSVICDPMDYRACLATIAGAHLVVTDSGGVQEEAAMIGTPALIARENTERPETLDCGSAQLVPAGEMGAMVSYLLKRPESIGRMEVQCEAYGDGHAGRRIAEILERAVV